MSFIDNLRKALTPELYTQVMDALGDDFDFDLVPRSRLNKVIGQRNDLRKQLAEGSQPQNNPAPKGNDEDDDDDGGTPGAQPKAKPPVDGEALRQQLEAEKKQAVQEVRIQYAALDKLRAAGAIDADLIYGGGLIDKTKVKVDDAGTVTGLDEIIADLQKNKAHLFKAAGSDVPPGTGKGGDEGFKGVNTREDFLKLSAEQQLAFKQANPAAFKQFLSAN